MHKISPWDYSRLDQPREQRKARNPVSFLSLDICPVHPVELLDGVQDGFSFPNASLEDGVPCLPWKKVMLLSQQANHPQTVQATVSKLLKHLISGTAMVKMD